MRPVTGLGRRLGSGPWLAPRHFICTKAVLSRVYPRFWNGGGSSGVVFITCSVLEQFTVGVRLEEEDDEADGDAEDEAEDDEGLDEGGDAAVAGPRPLPLVGQEVVHRVEGAEGRNN